jgi:phosphatidylinositol glycan class M
MWYLSFLPLVLPQTRLVKENWRTGIVMLSFWIAGQGVWLYFAFGLEHMGRNTFYELWIAGILFYLSQIELVASFIRNKVQ